MISWNCSSVWAICIASPFPMAALKSTSALFNDSSSSAVILWHARSMASSSKERRTSRTSRRLLSEIFATSAPFLGIMRTRPSSSSLRIASRIGVRLTPSRSASWISIRRSPGSSSPFKIAWRRVLNTTSRNGRYSSIFTSK